MAHRVAASAVRPEGRLAVVDLGSNTFRLVVLRYRPGGAFQLTDEVREVVRLSAGATSGRLRPEALERARRTAGLYAAFCRSADIEDVDAVATSAIRDAANRDEALRAVGGPGRLPVRVLSAEEEARYGYLGAINSTTLSDGALLDIGGGSVQVAAVSARRMWRAMSEPLGAVRMTEAFLPGARTTKGELKALRRHLAARLAPLDWAEAGADRLVGIGGTIRTLGIMALKAADHPLDEIHGYRVGRDALAELVEALAALPVAQRSRLPGLKPDRADIMLAGAVVVEQVMRRVGAAELEVCSQGLREGVFYERYLRDVDPPLIPDVLVSSVMNLAERYRWDRPHAEHVGRLALDLFDDLAGLGLHAGDPWERRLLWAASVLHDVGVMVDYNDHHKHGFYLVLNAGLPGADHRELALIALLVRSHRKGPPSLENLGPVLRPGDEARLFRLATLLRVAEQLERGRAQLVRTLDCTLRDGAVRVTAGAEGDSAVALWAAGQQAPLFERAFGRRLELTLG